MMFAILGVAAASLAAATGASLRLTNPAAWTVENFHDALSVRFSNGVLRVEGTGKQKDTAWSVTSGMQTLSEGAKELAVSLRMTSTRFLTKGATVDAQKSSVLWFGANGGRLEQTTLALPAIAGLERVFVRDVVSVPTNAAKFQLRLGFDRPDLKDGEFVELTELEVCAMREAGCVKPTLEKPDLRPVVIERKSASPFQDSQDVVTFTVADPQGVDWDSLSVLVDGADRTTLCRRIGNEISVLPPQEGWSNGLHVAKISIRSLRKGIHATERRAFFRGNLPNTPPVTLRDDGLVMIDGHPFFPIGVYDVRIDKRMPGVDLDKAHENLAKAGFDMSHSYKSIYRQPKRKVALEKYGFRQWVAARVPDADFLECGRFDPSIVAWYLGDDTSENTTPEELRFFNSAVKAADPTRITVQADATYNQAIDAYQYSRYSSYVTGTDVYMPEIYPFKGAPGGSQYTSAVAKVCQQMETVHRDVRLYNDGKPRGCWPILQAFVGWGQWKQFPTLDQIYSTSMAAIVHGAQGIMWYTYCGSNSDYGFATSKERWDAMRFTSLKVRELVPVLVERVPKDRPSVVVVSGPERDVFGASSVTCLMKRHAGETYLLAVNSAESSVRVRFVGLVGRCEGEAMWEGRRVVCNANGTLDDLFGPFAVHVYRFPKSFPAPEKGVLLLTFDDPNYDRWVKYIPLFEKFDAHASFFPYGKLEEEALNKMVALKRAGHTVGTHTVDHVNVPDYIKDYGEDEFWKQQIRPHLRAYAKVGIKVLSFAYPNGRRTGETDNVLKKHGIRHIRGCGDGIKEHRVTFYDKDGSRSSEWRPVSKSDYAFNRIEDLDKSETFFGATVGEAYHTDINDICAAIRRAAKENKVLQLTSHDIAPDAKNIDMKEDWLERILKTAREEGVRMIGYDELPLR